MFIGAISSGGILSSDFPAVVTAQWSCRISSVNSCGRKYIRSGLEVVLAQPEAAEGEQAGDETAGDPVNN